MHYPSRSARRIAHCNPCRVALQIARQLFDAEGRLPQLIENARGTWSLCRKKARQRRRAETAAGEHAEYTLARARDLERTLSEQDRRVLGLDVGHAPRQREFVSRPAILRIDGQLESQTGSRISDERSIARQVAALG
jgi:hypothetical protein